LLTKKNYKKMNEEKLISLMENFTGQKFQWIKTNRPELLGKVVVCRNIEPRGDKFFAHFDDGSTVDTNQLNTNLLMISGDMPPLTKEEVEAIAGPRRPILNQGQPRQNTMQQAGQNISQPRAQQTNVPAAPKSNMFDMFSSENSQISLSLLVKLPDKKLLKLMYSNAEDKEKFLEELSEYVFREINKNVVKDAIVSIIVPSGQIKRERSGPAITVNEIHET
jgi:hypothetical protein